MLACLMFFCSFPVLSIAKLFSMSSKRPYFLIIVLLKASIFFFYVFNINININTYYVIISVRLYISLGVNDYKQCKCSNKIPSLCIKGALLYSKVCGVVSFVYYSYMHAHTIILYI